MNTLSIGFLSKDMFAEDDRNTLIKSQAKELQYMEFKASGSLHLGDVKKAEIAKDVSAFANSDGRMDIPRGLTIRFFASSLFNCE